MKKTTATVPTIILIALVSALLLAASGAFAQSSTSNLTRTATWIPPTARENGDLLAPGDLAAFRLYRMIDAKPVLGGTYAGTATSAALALQPATCYELYLTAVDQGGLESLPSNTVKVCTYGPKAPTGLQVNFK